jgi:HSP20 family protein
MGKRSREFYEFVMPAIDMYEDANDLIVKIDLPGFKKDEIRISIEEDVLSIRAKRMEPQDERLGTILYKQRPVQIDKRIPLPISIKEGEKVTGIATYLDGVVTLKIPTSRVNIIPVT